ncbi:light-mediated development protein DET1-like isoform X2 [Curcuma longa]|uniref:light-mediated development protein DET1-like isoform X2 n=1 Tax=Curcuma longa TaxID=136217 RepID=UPI003D9E57FD
MFRITNVAARVFERQIHAPRPGASINFVRQFYENLVPGCTICDIDCPDHSFRKFTDDGQYLVSVSRNMQDIIVFRPKWLSYSFRGENCDHQTLTQKAKKFDSLFTHLYSISLGSSNEFICKEFFLYLENHQFGLFATSTTQSPIEGAIHGLPSIDKITFHLVRLNDGVVMDEKSFCNDYVNLVHNMGVFLYENLLCILSLRHQTIHILQVRDSGNLVDVRSIGPFCLEDDELFLNSNSQVTEANSFISGIKQRLLSFIFRKAWNEEPDPSLRVQHLKKKFYYHFQDYLDLIMLKQVQFLDHQHLLLKFGSADGGYAKKMLSTLPYTCQSQSPSPYFDLSLFRYDEKLISSTDRHRHSTDHPIKFISRRQPNVPKFKIKTGIDTGGADNRAKRSSFLFHPYLPLVLSIQQTYMQPTVVNIHLRL